MNWLIYVLTEIGCWQTSIIFTLFWINRINNSQSLTSLPARFISSLKHTTQLYYNSLKTMKDYHKPKLNSKFTCYWHKPKTNLFIPIQDKFLIQVPKIILASRNIQVLYNILAKWNVRALFLTVAMRPNTSQKPYHMVSNFIHVMKTVGLVMDLVVIGFIMQKLIYHNIWRSNIKEILTIALKRLMMVQWVIQGKFSITARLVIQEMLLIREITRFCVT